MILSIAGRNRGHITSEPNKIWNHLNRSLYKIQYTHFNTYVSIIYTKDKYGIGNKNELIFRRSVRTPVENGSNDKLNITDLNQFCLEHIFTYLDFEDLLSVADANKYLRPATIAPFTQKYGTKWIKFEYSFPGQLSIKNDQIKIHNFKTFFQTLRSFGQSIHKLDILHSSCLYKNNYQNNWDKYKKFQ